MYAVKATGTLRVSREGELEGLDLHEHGVVAYPEYALIAAAAATAHVREDGEGRDRLRDGAAGQLGRFARKTRGDGRRAGTSLGLAAEPFRHFCCRLPARPTDL